VVDSVEDVIVLRLLGKYFPPRSVLGPSLHSGLTSDGLCNKLRFEQPLNRNRVQEALVDSKKLPLDEASRQTFGSSYQTILIGNFRHKIKPAATYSS
jgi:hypothetical protein